MRLGSISVSNAIVRNATQLSQLDTTQWQGDQVEVEAPHGAIRVRYVDEVEEVEGKMGVLSRLFGK